jgi:hypothetical protein
VRGFFFERSPSVDKAKGSVVSQFRTRRPAFQQALTEII